MIYQVRNGKGGIDYQGPDYAKAFSIYRLLPNKAKLLENSPKGWVKATEPDIKKLENELKKL